MSCFLTQKKCWSLGSCHNSCSSYLFLCQTKKIVNMVFISVCHIETFLSVQQWIQKVIPQIAGYWEVTIPVIGFLFCLTSFLS